MRNPVIKLANNTHRDIPLVSKNSERERVFDGKQFLRGKNIKTTEIYTHVSKKELGKIVNPLDDYG